MATRPLRATIERNGKAVGLPATFGKVSWFGGPLDPVIGEHEMNWTDRVRLKDLKADGWYLAMRWDAHQPALKDLKYKAKGWWEEQRIRVWNEDFTKAVVLQPLDWGPGIYSRVGDLCNGAMKHLGVVTDGRCFFEFVSPDHPLGPVDLTKKKGDK